MLPKILSKYILQIIFNNINLKRRLKITHHNRIQKDLEIALNDYKKIYNEIEFELEVEKPEKDQKNYFIQFINDVSLYRIYFDSKEISKPIRRYISPEDNVNKIKVVLDGKIASLSYLFAQCRFIKKMALYGNENYSY